jgi:hypothetical protein
MIWLVMIIRLLDILLLHGNYLSFEQIMLLATCIHNVMVCLCCKSPAAPISLELDSTGAASSVTGPAPISLELDSTGAATIASSVTGKMKSYRFKISGTRHNMHMYKHVLTIAQFVPRIKIYME